MIAITSTLTAALRQAADLLDQHPHLPEPYISGRAGGTADLSWYLHGREDHDTQKATAATIVRAIGGTWDKATDSPLGFSFEQSVGSLHLFISVDRASVCERVVIGTETRTVPAVEAQPERVETVEKVRWECRPLLADDHTEAVAVST